MQLPTVGNQSLVKPLKHLGHISGDSGQRFQTSHLCIRKLVSASDKWTSLPGTCMSVQVGLILRNSISLPRHSSDAAQLPITCASKHARRKWRNLSAMSRQEMGSGLLLAFARLLGHVLCS